MNKLALLEGARLFAKWVGRKALALAALLIASAGFNSAAQAQTVPTISCTTPPWIFNTAALSEHDYQTSGSDSNWEIAWVDGQSNPQGVPPNLSYQPATIIESQHQPPVWIQSPYHNANWISHSPSGAHGFAGGTIPYQRVDSFYRYRFDLSPDVEAAVLALDMTFYSDNSVIEVYVNGVPQNIASPYGATDPYLYVGYQASGGASGTLAGNFKEGQNEILVHTKSAAGAQGFLAQMNGAVLCKPRLTLAKEVVNDNGGSADDADFLLRAEGPAGNPVLIEGGEGEPSVTHVVVEAGTFTFGEENRSGYAASYSCEIENVDGTSTTDGQTVEIALGDTVTCTVTNDDFAPRKDLTGESGALPGVAEPGEILTYTITLTNNGTTPALYDLVDDIDDNTEYQTGSTAGTAGAGEPTGTDPITWGGLTVPPNGSVTVEYQVRVKDEIPAGVASIANVAYEASTTPDCTINPDACEEMPVSGAVTLEKELTGETGTFPEVAEPGETLTYTITLSNAGQAASIYDLADDLDDNTTYISDSTSGTAGAGEPTGTDPLLWQGITVPANDSVTVVYQVQVSDPIPGDASAVTNAAYEDGTSPDCVGSPHTCSSIPVSGGVVLKKDITHEDGLVPDVAEPGETLTYTITLTNTGAGGALYDLADDLDQHVAYIGPTSGTAGAGEPTGTDPLVWSAIEVPADGAVTIIYEARVADDIPEDVSTIANIAYEDGTTPDCAANPAACVQRPVSGKVTLTKELTAESGSLPEVAEPGETLTYTVTLTNEGAGATFDLADGLDANTDYVAGSTSGTAGAGEPTGTGPLVWEDIVVPADGEVAVVYQVKVADPIPAGSSTVGNVAYAAGTTPDCAGNPATCVEIPVPGVVSLEKALSEEDGIIDGVAEPGETLTFTVTLSNDGRGAALYDLADDLDDDMSYVAGSTSGTADTGEPAGTDPVAWRGITVPAGDSVTVTYQVKVADEFSANGRILRNIAYEEAAGPNCAGNPQSCVDIPPPGRIKLKKSLTGEGGVLDGVAEPGETLTYTVTLTNDEDVATLIDLADSIDAHTSYVEGSTAGTAGADEPEGSGPLVWKSLVVPAKTTVTVEYQVKVVEEIAEDVESVRNLVYRDGDPEPDCAAEPDHCVIVPVPGPVRLEKALMGESGMVDDLAEPGETLTYTVTLTNEGGGATLYDLSDKIDSHSSYVPGSTSGTAGAEEPEGTNPLNWRGIVVPAGQDVTITYDVTVADTIPSGVQNIGNVAYREGTDPDCGAGTASCVSVPVVSVTKVAERRQIRRGEQAPFTLRVVGGAGTQLGALTVTDRLPSGFRFVEGSATVNGTPATPIVEGQQVIFENLSFGEESELVIRLRMAALPSLIPGKYVNRVGVDGPNGQRMAEASAEVEIIVEPVFDCGEIIGRVFDDLDRNGYQDPGEPGLPGVRVSTVSGLLVKTDRHGRFHVACADLPDRIGTNFIMKLDPRTLPTGYRLISENPRVVRLSAGKTSRLNFAATISRAVRLDVNDAAFEPGTVLLRPEWQAQLQQLVELLEDEVSILRLAYVDAGADRRLATDRITEIRRTVSDLWRAQPGRYRLEIETRVETRE